MTASTASRKKLVAGNWKMNLNRSQAIDLSAAIALRHAEAGSVELVLCPPSVYLDAVGSVLRLTGGQSPTGVSLGAQNMHEKASGAFTGEVAAAMLVDCSCHFVIVGHSERRTLFLETNAAVNAKTRAALAAGLTNARLATPRQLSVNRYATRSWGFREPIWGASSWRMNRSGPLARARLQRLNRRRKSTPSSANC